MNATRSAFPVLMRRAGGRARAKALTDLPARLCSVTQAGLPELQEQLDGVAIGSVSATDEGLRCTLEVGPDISVPLTVVGMCDDDTAADDASGTDSFVLHSPGLHGGFVASRQELLRSRARVSSPPGASPSATAADATDPPTSLGAVCLFEAVNAHFTAAERPLAAGEEPRGGILDEFYRRARRRHFSLAGMAHLLECGGRLHAPALQLDFPYQCGGAQATKRYLDITPAVADVFGARVRHGAKVLSRYGTAASVGVVDRMGTTLATPALLWHPSGAPAACLAPLLHGCRLLPNGSVSLDYNGPIPGSPLTALEDPRRYMNLTVQGRYDDSLWLTHGLFGVKPGSTWTPPSPSRAGNAVSTQPAFEVVGVGYCEWAAEMELFIREQSTGEVVPAADV